MDLNALAFTLGSEIFFAPGQFAPSSPDGLELIAHELMHVVQYDESRLPLGRGPGLDVSSPQDAHEREAVLAAQAVTTQLLASPPDTPTSAATLVERTDGIACNSYPTQEEGHGVGGSDGSVGSWYVCGGDGCGVGPAGALMASREESPTSKSALTPPTGLGFAGTQNFAPGISAWTEGTNGEGVAAQYSTLRLRVFSIDARPADIDLVFADGSKQIVARMALVGPEIADFDMSGFPIGTNFVHVLIGDRLVSLVAFKCVSLEDYEKMERIPAASTSGPSMAVEHDNQFTKQQRRDAKYLTKGETEGTLLSVTGLAQGSEIAEGLQLPVIITSSVPGYHQITLIDTWRSPDPSRPDGPPLARHRLLTYAYLDGPGQTTPRNVTLLTPGNHAVQLCYSSFSADGSKGRTVDTEVSIRVIGSEEYLGDKVLESAFRDAEQRYAVRGHWLSDDSRWSDQSLMSHLRSIELQIVLKRDKIVVVDLSLPGLSAEVTGPRTDDLADSVRTVLGSWAERVENGWATLTLPPDLAGGQECIITLETEGTRHKVGNALGIAGLAIGTVSLFVSTGGLAGAILEIVGWGTTVTSAGLNIYNNYEDHGDQSAMDFVTLAMSAITFPLEGGAATLRAISGGRLSLEGAKVSVEMKAVRFMLSNGETFAIELPAGLFEISDLYQAYALASPEDKPRAWKALEDRSISLGYGLILEALSVPGALSDMTPSKGGQAHGSSATNPASSGITPGQPPNTNISTSPSGSPTQSPSDTISTPASTPPIGDDIYQGFRSK